MRIKISEVGSIESMNASRVHGPYFVGAGEMGVLVDCLSTGWKENQGTPAVLSVKEADRIRPFMDHAAVVMEHRIKELARLKHTDEEAVVVVPVEGANDKKVTITGADAAICYEEMYFKAGKPIKPKYVLNSAFRRTYTLPWVNAFLWKQSKGEGTEPKGLYTEFVVHECLFVNEDARIKDNIEENAHKLLGSREVDTVSTLVNVQGFHERGHSEASIRRIFGFGRGIAQKYCRICQLDAMHCDAELIKNVILTAKDPKTVLAAIDKEDVMDLLEGVKIEGKHRTNCAAPLEEATAYLMNPKGNKTPNRRPASKAAIDTFLKGCNIKPFRVVLKAVLNNDLASLGNYLSAKSDINSSWKELTEGLVTSAAGEDDGDAVAEDTVS